jgi:hypothetical protein
LLKTSVFHEILRASALPGVTCSGAGRAKRFHPGGKSARTLPKRSPQSNGGHRRIRWLSRILRKFFSKTARWSS